MIMNATSICTLLLALLCQFWYYWHYFYFLPFFFTCEKVQWKRYRELDLGYIQGSTPGKEPSMYYISIILDFF